MVKKIFFILILVVLLYFNNVSASNKCVYNFRELGYVNVYLNNDNGIQTSTVEYIQKNSGESTIKTIKSFDTDNFISDNKFKCLNTLYAVMEKISPGQRATSISMKIFSESSDDDAIKMKWNKEKSILTNETLTQEDFIRKCIYKTYQNNQTYQINDRIMVIAYKDRIEASCENCTNKEVSIDSNITVDMFRDSCPDIAPSCGGYNGVSSCSLNRLTGSFLDDRTPHSDGDEVKNYDEINEPEEDFEQEYKSGEPYYFCDQDGVKQSFQIIGYLLFIAKLLIPLILIVLGTLDFVKSLTNSDEKSSSESIKKFVTRIIIAVIIFLLPSILNFLLSFIDGAMDASKRFNKCSDCLFSPLDKNKCSYKSIREKVNEVSK